MVRMPATDGNRVTTVTRDDGTRFTVTIPPGALDAVGDPHFGPWIVEHGPPRRPSEDGLNRLAAAVTHGGTCSR
jgi:hypothetical protein